MVKQITTMKELLEIIPFVMEQKKLLKNKFGPRNDEEFLQKLIGNFNTAWYFGQIIDNKLAYFWAILPNGENEVFIWLVYHNKTFYSESKNLIKELRIRFKGSGIKKATWCSPLLSSSYHRWVEKQGAKLITRTYEVEL